MHMRSYWPAVTALMLTSACTALPRDPDATLTDIQKSRQINVGLIADPHPLAPGRVQALLVHLRDKTGATLVRRSGAAEPLLDQLRHGELDLVIGTFTEETPWETDVALAPPIAIAGPQDRRLELRAAAKNGENAWIMMVERASKAVAPMEASQ